MATVPFLKLLGGKFSVDDARRMLKPWLADGEEMTAGTFGAIGPHGGIRMFSGRPVWLVVTSRGFVVLRASWRGPHRPLSVERMVERRAVRAETWRVRSDPDGPRISEASFDLVEQGVTKHVVIPGGYRTLARQTYEALRHA